MAFNPREHMSNIKGRDYLEVKWRIVWFRDVHPAGSIDTDIIEIAGHFFVRAIVSDGNGKPLATGLSTVRSGEGQTWAGREIEKAETSAIGRALAHAGYGTQFTSEDENEGSYLPDSPVERPATPKRKGKSGDSKRDVNFNDYAFDFLALRDDGRLNELYSPVSHLVNAIKKLCREGDVTQNMNTEQVKTLLIGRKDEEEIPV